MIWAILKGVWDKMTPGPGKLDYFDDCFKFIMKWEGGDKYTNDPDDPGGETKFGISKRSHPGLDIKNLTEEKAKEIYRAEYWGTSGADTAEWPLCLAIFDSAVNCGVSRAKKWNAGSGGGKGKAIYVLEQRERYYQDLIRKRPVMKKYFRGWMARINDLRGKCL